VNKDAEQPADESVILVGHVAGVHGVKGWVKIHSLTEPREAIFDYQPWLMGDALEKVVVRQGKKHGKRLIALLKNTETREQAEDLVNTRISVRRGQFPEPASGEYYWTDLIGLKVKTTEGTGLGKIENLLATGANDVMVVQGDRERLIPFVLEQYVRQVDLDNGEVIVDWDPDF
jgi:16S rRNA processing protein RimM